jgi:hypothetical protein
MFPEKKCSIDYKTPDKMGNVLIQRGYYLPIDAKSGDAPDIQSRAEG